MASRSSWFIIGVVAGLSAAAIGQELAKPQAERTWKGTIAGVPYNFRLEEWPEMTNEYWNPESERILVPHTIGLGWGVNFAALKRRAEALLGLSAPANGVNGVNGASAASSAPAQPPTEVGV